jgi:hypothetical protein
MQFAANKDAREQRTFQSESSNEALKASAAIAPLASAIKTIDRLTEMGPERFLGMWDAGVVGNIAQIFPESATGEFRRNIAFLKDKAFMDGFEALKGGGQISNEEGRAARNAITNLSVMMSPAEFNTRLGELRDIFERAKLRNQLGVSARNDDGATVITPATATNLIASDFFGANPSKEIVDGALKRANIVISQ